MEIKYEIRYSERKTIGITVERDRSVVVCAPFGTRPDIIGKLIEKKRVWLNKKINGINKFPEKKSYKEFVSGESLIYLGSIYKLKVVSDDFDGVKFDNCFSISIHNRNKANMLLKEFYQSGAKEILVPRIKRFAENLGVKHSKILITDSKYRWGSCTPKGNITFNWRIIKAPVNVIDYIIVHELAHLLESNHTATFWNIVSVQLPQYKKAKEWLKENGGVLDAEF